MVLYCLTCTFSLKVLIFLFCRILTCLIEDENHYIYLDTLFEEFNTSSGNDIEPVFTKRAFSSRLRLVFPQIRSTSSTCDNKNVTLMGSFLELRFSWFSNKISYCMQLILRNFFKYTIFHSVQ